MTLAFFKWMRKQPCIVCNTYQHNGAQLVSVFGTIEGVRVGRPIPFCDLCVSRFLAQGSSEQNQFFPVANKIFETWEGDTMPKAKQGARGMEVAR